MYRAKVIERVPHYKAKRAENMSLEEKMNKTFDENSSFTAPTNFFGSSNPYQYARKKTLRRNINIDGVTVSTPEISAESMAIIKQ